MNFKMFISERRRESDTILRYIRTGHIPISPKVIEKIKGSQKPDYCFMAIQIDRIPSVIKRQHKRNQMSTFKNWYNTNIFWGADGLGWSEEGTIIAVLKGKTTLSTREDMWTANDQTGRRWIEADASSFSLEIGSVFIKIAQDLRSRFDKKLDQYIKKSDKYMDILLPDIPNQDRILLNGDVPLKVYNETKREYIKMYFDSAEESLKKYYKDIIRAYDNDDTEYYDEHLCYEYEIIEFIYLNKTMDNDDLLQRTLEDNEKEFKKYEKQGYKFTEAKSEQDLEKKLKMYQNKI